MNLRDDLIDRATRYGWTQMSGTACMFHNVAFYRDLDEHQREWLELRLKHNGTKLTSVRWRHPAYDEPQRITQRKLDHVHALLRARPVASSPAPVLRLIKS